MNDPTLIGPCAEYEYEIVDLQDGGLPAGRARAVLAHLDGCPRCRAWAAELAALDTRLAATLPRPALSPDFDARLRERIDSLAVPARRGELRSRLEREHDSMLDALRRGARRRAALEAIAPRPPRSACSPRSAACSLRQAAGCRRWPMAGPLARVRHYRSGDLRGRARVVGGRNRGVDLSWLR